MGNGASIAHRFDPEGDLSEGDREHLVDMWRQLLVDEWHREFARDPSRRQYDPANEEQLKHARDKLKAVLDLGVRWVDWEEACEAAVRKARASKSRRESPRAQHSLGQVPGSSAWGGMTARRTRMYAL